MVTAGGIQNTHYNLVDTLKQFMGSEWDRCYGIIVENLQRVYLRDYLECIGPCPYPIIDKGLAQMLSNNESIIKSIDYPQPIRYTIVETAVWHYINSEVKE